MKSGGPQRLILQRLGCSSRKDFFFSFIPHPHGGIKSRLSRTDSHFRSARRLSQKKGNNEVRHQNKFKSGQNGKIRTDPFKDFFFSFIPHTLGAAKSRLSRADSHFRLARRLNKKKGNNEARDQNGFTSGQNGIIRTDPFMSQTARPYLPSGSVLAIWGSTVPSRPIDATKMVVGDFGTFDPDGVKYKAFSDGDTRDLTVTVKGVDYFAFSVVPVKYTLKSTVQCPAAADPNLERTSLGVGEKVTLGNLPPETHWSTTSGATLSSYSGPSTTLTAPINAQGANKTTKVTATVRGERADITFDINEPSGVETSIHGGQAGQAVPGEYFAGPYPRVAAGMQLDVVMLPKTVSFHGVEMEEPAEATTATDYFSNIPYSSLPQHAGHGANEWHQIDCNNLIHDLAFDHAWADVGWPIGYSGTYTWPIHPVWRVVGTTSTHPLSGWTDQVFTLSSDGTMRIDKLGYNVVRGPYQTRGSVTKSAQ